MTLYVGMGAGYSISVTVTSSSAFAPATVSAPKMVVHKPSGERATWAATITTQNSSLVTFAYELGAEDLTIDGEWSVYFTFETATPGERKRTNTQTFRVEKEF
jgi:hypothetical protein